MADSLDDPAVMVMTDPMTSHDEPEALCMDDVGKAVVGSDRRHASAVRTVAYAGGRSLAKQPDAILVRLFSAPQIAHQLDADLSTPRIVQTFADIERLITKS